MIATLFLIALTAIIVGAGWTMVGLADRKATVPAPERLLAAFGLGCILLYLGIFAIGPFRLDRASMLGVMGLAALVALPSWRAAAQAVSSGSLQRVACNCRAFAAAHPFAAMVWAVVVLSLVLVLVQGFAPPNDYDSLNYHISLPQRDVEQGFIGADWQGHFFSFFPALSEHLYRLALAVGGGAAAQPVTGLFGIALALTAALLVHRLGFGPATAALAALMVVSVRATVWELATCEVEPQLAVYAGLAMLAYMHWRDNGGMVWMLVFGAALAGGTLVKYHGLAVAACFGPLVLWDLAMRRRPVVEVLAGTGAALALLLPHALRNIHFTGNPIFPIYNRVLTKGGPEFFAVALDEFGRGRGVLDFLRVYWDASILPTYYFDGAMLGAPYLLAFAPFALWMGRGRGVAPMAVVTILFSAAWYWGITKQVRFLITITPFLAAFAAIGATVAWQQGGRLARVAVAVAGLVLAGNQALFVGIYALLRVPPAVGLMDAASYHSKTPTMTGAFYGACTYVRDRLAADEWLLSLIAPHSYYCPQARAIITPALPEEADYWLTARTLPALTGPELAAAMERYKVRFVVMESSREYRSGPNSAPLMVQTDYSKDRLGSLIQPLTKDLTPLYQDANSAVYDGLAVAAELMKHQR